MRRLDQRFGAAADVALVVVHQREPHAGQMAFQEIAQPTTFEERRALALRARDELELKMPILVDGMDDQSRALFGDLPSPAFVIDEEGTIRAKLPWADPEQIETIVGRLLAAPTSRPDSRVASLAETVAAARKLVLRGKTGEAARALRARQAEWARTGPASEPTHAEAFVTLALAVAGTPEAAATQERAAALARAAWQHAPARLVAALVELAEAGQSAELYREALRTLEPRAPLVQRAWLEQRIAAVGTASRPAQR